LWTLRIWASDFCNAPFWPETALKPPRRLRYLMSDCSPRCLTCWCRWERSGGDGSWLNIWRQYQTASWSPTRHIKWPEIPSPSSSRRCSSVLLLFLHQLLIISCYWKICLLFCFQTSKFENFTDYNNFLPSFEVKLPADVTTLSLQLRSIVAPSRLLGWLFSPTYCEVWTRVVHLRGDCRGTHKQQVTRLQPSFLLVSFQAARLLVIFKVVLINSFPGFLKGFQSLDTFCFSTHFQSSPCSWAFSEECVFSLFSHLTLTYEPFRQEKGS